MYLFYKILVIFQVMQTDIHCVADLGGGVTTLFLSFIFIIKSYLLEKNNLKLVHVTLCIKSYIRIAIL